MFVKQMVANRQIILELFWAFLSAEANDCGV